MSVESPFAALATGVGSWPGTDFRESTSIVLGELDVLPHIVELPGRGVGADMIGRTGALMADIELDVRSSGYRVVARPMLAGRRATDFLHEDLDVLEEIWETAGHRDAGRTLKVQAAGPFTMAAQVELRNGHRVVTDRGALRDFAGALAEGLRENSAELASRLGVEVVVQLDEPSLPDVLAGTLRGVTSLETISAVPEPEALDLLDSVIAAIGRPVAVHSCGSNAPFDLLRRSAAVAVGFDLSKVTPAELDGVGELFEAGKVLVLGLVPSTDPGRDPGWRDLASHGVVLVDKLGFPRRILADQVSVSPTCGLAGASPDWARRALALSKDISSAFTEAPDAL